MKSLPDALGYAFNDSKLLTRALTHSSYAHEKGLKYDDCNERLEFLGDATLELTISDDLFRSYPNLTEGELTKKRAAMVCEPSLACIARELSLGEYLLLGRGEEQSGGRDRDSLLSDALEAVFGAVLIDGGIAQAQEVILRLFASVSPEETGALTADHKTDLQEIIQKNSREPAVYMVVDESGPAHRKAFTVTVSHQGRELGTGQGHSKKEAEQNAAGAAIRFLSRQ